MTDTQNSSKVETLEDKFLVSFLVKSFFLLFKIFFWPYWTEWLSNHNGTACTAEWMAHILHKFKIMFGYLEHEKA